MVISDVPQIEMRRIDITVSFADSPDDGLVTVIGFIGPDQTSGAAAGGQNTSGAQPNSAERRNGFGSGWEPPQENLEGAG